MLKVKLLDPRAKAPACSHPREDLGYDLFALEDTVLYPHSVTKVRTGVAVQGTRTLLTPCSWGYSAEEQPLGFIVKDRSSMAWKGIITHGGVIDAGYRGEIVVLMSSQLTQRAADRQIKAGDKIAQLVPIPVLTAYPFEVVEELGEADRGEKGFGSSGR